jgi:phosphoribosylaminoimidazolecarboxamide formyltransferase/IMP cyclohydrolase
MDNITINTALISVTDKRSIVSFAESLSKKNVEIISTGGTAKILSENNITVCEISNYTGFPEILDGRVKTLHPKVHAGILYKRDVEEHTDRINEFNVKNINLVVVNLYPFEKTVSRQNILLEEAIENIDIGGPSLIRAAAKNFENVVVVVDPLDYEEVIDKITKGEITYKFRLQLAKKAFNHTAYYDSIIANFFNNLTDEKFPPLIVLPAKKLQSLRYGENPHQEAAFYKKALSDNEANAANAKQLHGKDLSYNNIVDIDAAIELIKEFAKPSCAIIKHTNPCGAATAENIYDSFLLALQTDPDSAFGGIVCVNRPVEKELAKKLKEIFFEVIISTKFSDEALNILKNKINIRLIEVNNLNSQNVQDRLEIKNVTGGFLIQDRNLTTFIDNKIKVVTKREPSPGEMNALKFAWKIVKHVKSNAIVITNENQLLGVGAGQMSRVDSCKIAAIKARKSLVGSVMASDAFFPFRDSVDEAAKYGITAIIQPGGSIKDIEVINAADEHNIAMVFTGIRHFKH